MLRSLARNLGLTEPDLHSELQVASVRGVTVPGLPRTSHGEQSSPSTAPLPVCDRCRQVRATGVNSADIFGRDQRNVMSWKANSAQTGARRDRLPDDDRPGQPHGTGPQTDPRHRRCPHHPGHHPRLVRLGVAELSAVLHPSRRRRSHGAGRRTAPTTAQPRYREAAQHSRRRRTPTGRRAGVQRGCDTRPVGHGPLRVGLPWTPGTRRTSRSSSTPAIPTPGWMRSVRPEQSAIELDGVVLAESSSPVMVFETGLPTRYYLNRSEANFDHLIPTRNADRLPLQGHHQRILVDPDRRDRASRPGLGLRLPDPAAATHRRIDRLLQREGRHLPRREIARTADNPFLQIAGGSSSFNDGSHSAGTAWVAGVPADMPG